MLKTVALQTVEASINFVLTRDPQSKERLAALEDKVIEFKITDLKFNFYWVCEQQRVRLLSEWESAVDAIIEAPLNALAKIGLQQTTKEVTISGDLSTVETFKRLFSELDINWEEQLAPLTGDALAFKLGDLARKATKFMRNTAESLRENTKEYLHEESTVVAPRAHFREFSSDVRELNRAVDRLELRVKSFNSIKSSGDKS
jgi:ubiquinone biosynthesis protein UbiJ